MNLQKSRLGEDAKPMGEAFISMLKSGESLDVVNKIKKELYYNAATKDVLKAQILQSLLAGEVFKRPVASG